VITCDCGEPSVKVFVCVGRRSRRPSSAHGSPQWVVAELASGIVGSADAPGTPSGLARVGESDPQLPSLVRAYCGATLA